MASNIPAGKSSKFQRKVYEREARNFLEREGGRGEREGDRKFGSQKKEDHTS